MSDALWVVRAGEGARYAAEFLQNGYIAVDYAVLAADDLSGVDESALKARAATHSERMYVAQLIPFVRRMAPGDLVIVPRLTGTTRDYLVARITGPYEYAVDAPPSGHHRRAVTWVGAFSRDVLSETAAKTLDSAMTVFRAAAVEPELRVLLTALAPIDTPAAAATPAPALNVTDSIDATRSIVAVAPPHRPLTEAQLDIVLDRAGRARITSAYPALVMEQTPRHVDPAPDWARVPGIYVLTGTDVQQSLTRTGNERTLTTTLIVRPWAYVGLSEDFLGRMGSHRQSKPEWRRALLVRSGGQPFSSDDIKYLERRVHEVLVETGEVLFAQAVPRGNLSAHPRNPTMLDACAETVVAVLRLTGTLI